MLRRLAVLVLAATGFAGSAAAQALEIRPFVGYRDGGELREEAGRRYDIAGDVTFGLAVDFDLRRDIGVQLLVSRLATSAEPESSGVGGPLGLSVTHWLVGPSKSFFPRSRLRPDAALLGGFSTFSPDLEGHRSVGWFTLAPVLGATYFPWQRVGLRLEGRGFITFTNTGTPFACEDTGGGCILRFVGNTMFQPEIAASVVFALGQRY
jgi:hypothetical protein